MPGRGKAKTPSTPDFNDAAGWGLWRLSLVLSEIAGRQKEGAKKKEAHPQGSAEITLACREEGHPDGGNAE